MQLKHKMMLLGSIPLIIVIFLISLMFINESNKMADNEIALIHEVLLKEKKIELKNYTYIALSAIEQDYQSALRGNQLSLKSLSQKLRKMQYGADGYFYLYDVNGTNIMHPKQSYREGKNWIDLKDEKGNMVILDLIHQARFEDGYTSYVWEQPSKQSLADKISYNVELKGLGLILGTGLYVTNIDKETDVIKGFVQSSILNSVIISIILTILSLIVIYFFTFSLNTRELSLADKRIARLNARSTNAQEKERARLSVELHDGVSQHITATRFEIELAQKTLALTKDKDKAQKILNGALIKLREIGQEIRQISHDLRPRNLDDLGLIAAIENEISNLTQRTKIDFQFIVDCNEDEIGDSISNSLYRIFQEATRNIEKHAKAKNVSIELKVEGSNVFMSFVDDGKGFNYDRIEQKSNGIGIYNMQQRVKSHLGQITFNSTKTGTYINIEIPLSKQDIS